MYYKWFLIIILLMVLEQVLRHLMPKLKGASGEAAVGHILSHLPKEEYSVLHNVMLRTNRGTSQIDHIVVSVYGIFVIEEKNYAGWIAGSENSSQWTQTIHKTKNHFMNPLHQNYGHIKAIEALLADPTVPIFSIVTFPGDTTLKVHVQNAHVVKWGALNGTIRKLSKEKILDPSRVQEIADLLKKSNVDSAKARKEHVQAIDQKKEAIDAGICPRCGGKLVVRKGKYGKFLGCSNYPKCKYTKPL